MTTPHGSKRLRINRSSRANRMNMADALNNVVPTLAKARTLISRTGVVGALPGGINVTVTLSEQDITMPVLGAPPEIGDQVVVFVDGDRWYCLGKMGSFVNPAYLPNTAGVGQRATSTGSDVTNSDTYVNMAGTGSVTNFTFTKKLAATRVRIDMTTGWWTTITSTGIITAVAINGIDYATCIVNASVPQQSHQSANGSILIPGLPVGPQIIQGRWRRLSGAGSINRDTGDWLSIMATEVT